MKEYFRVNAIKYVAGKDFEVVRPASLNCPKDNSVMFIMEKYMESVSVFQTVSNCLIFWPNEVDVPAELTERHAIVPCKRPHMEYCRFFQTNRIVYLPEKEEVRMVEGAFIANKAVIGKNAVIMPGAYIGGECVIGDDVYIGCGAKLIGEVHIGNRVVIRENAVIGADGLTTDRDENGVAVTMPQFGSVVIEDDAQIGANTVIARGAIDETHIARGAKVDNCCFISHNVHIGEDTFIVGESIMFGSSSIGKNSMISGNSAVRNGIHIGDRALVGMGSVVVKSVGDGCVVKGNPAK